MNKRKRMEAVLENREADQVPSSYWFHYIDIPDVKEKADVHLRFHKATDMDFMKIMYEFGYAPDFHVTKPSDWRRLVPQGRKSPEYLKQVELIQRIQDGLEEDCMVFTTMFGAFKMAQFMAGEDVLMAHILEDPSSVMAGIRSIADMLADWAEGYCELGVDGIMYATQYGERRRFQKAFWAETVKPCDEIVLSKVHEANKYILLHMCGMQQYQKDVELSRFVGYPMDIASWAVYSSHLSMPEGRDLFKCPVLGGMNNYGSLTGNDPEMIRKDVQNVIAKVGKAGLVMGADCVILENPRVENIRTAVMAAREI